MKTDRTRHAIAAAMGAVFLSAVAGSMVLFTRARHEAEIEARRAELQTALDENARRLHELQGSRFGSPTDGARLRPLTRRRELPDCRCAQGDPLCSEIPGQTCSPTSLVGAPTTGHR